MRCSVMEKLVESCREAKEALRNTDICWRTYALISCFALSSWITVNGIWSELPVIVNYAPEQWTLPSYVVIIIQVGIIGPLLYSLANRLSPRIVNEQFTIYLLIAIGMSSCIFLSLFWKRTTLVGGSPHSVALMVLVFTMSLVDCTSSIVFLTFMSLYDPRYLTALYIGESFCGLLPGLAAMIQGSPSTGCTNASSSSTNSTTTKQSSELLFSPETYFMVLLAMMVICGLAFFALNVLPFAKHEQKSETFVRTVVVIQSDDSVPTDDQILIQEPSSPRCDRMSWKHITMFVIQAVSCSLTFGIIPSLAPYAYEPYGSITYHLVASLGPMFTAIMCFFIIWLQKKSLRSIFVAFTLFACGCIYLIILACQSPTPWLYKSHLGKIIAVIAGMSVSSIGTYMRLTISIIMREESKRALYWCGMSIQIGSLVGAFSIFPFVNILHEFHQKNC